MADKDNRKSQWFRNAAKSIGYSLTDKLKEDDMAMSREPDFMPKR